MSKMRKNQLDEMQIQQRNKIGNQAFMILSFLLLFDIVLDGLGFRWLKYPTNVFIILLVCSCYYEVRLIWQGAYLGPEVKLKTFHKKLILVIFLTAVTAAMTSFFLHQYLSKNNAQEAGDNGAWILLVGSVAASIIMIAIYIIKGKRDKKLEE